MTLFYWNVPLSVLGRWCGVHKTTILRWVLGLALALWPLISRWLGERVKASMVYVDEKWLKIRGRWYYWFVVLDVSSELPVLAALLPSRGQWACRWVGRQLRQLKKVPKVLITDGLQAYAYLVPGAKHVLCRFHHQQGVTHWLKQHFTTEAEIDARQPAMKRLFQTPDKRTVRRRLARLKERAAAWGITPWVSTVEAKLPQLIAWGVSASPRPPTRWNASSGRSSDFTAPVGAFTQCSVPNASCCSFSSSMCSRSTRPRAKPLSKSSCPRHGPCPCTG